MSCGSPIGHERLVAYWAHDLGDAEVAAIDEHLFGCDACTGESARIAALVQSMRGWTPPVVSRAQVDELRAKGEVVRENEFVPGVRTDAVFEGDVTFLIHRLRGLDLAEATRVAVTIYAESTGPDSPIVVEQFAPFDVSRGEVLIACQRHFQSFLPDRNVAFDVRVYRNGYETTKHTYVIPHVFP